MATNDFLPFSNGAGANVISQAEYVALASIRANGFVSGTAVSQQLNKVWRQSSLISAAIGQFIVDVSGRDAIDDGSVSSILDALKISVQNQSIGVVGSTRNLKCNVTSPSSTSVFSADEIILESGLGGLTYRIANFSKTINLATTGAGGMDTGVVPANGFVAIYAIYNPATAASALLAVNATSSKAPEVYSGANMPSGYTASCLLTVVPITTSQFARCTVRDRDVRVVSVYNYTTSSVVTDTLVTASNVPFNAVTIDGTIEAGCTAASNVGTLISDGYVPGMGMQSIVDNVPAAGNSVAPYKGIGLNSSRQFAVSTAITGSGTATYKVATSGYRI